MSDSQFDNYVSQQIRENAGLLVNIVRSFYPRDQDQFEEYLQICRISLWEAIKDYDDTRDCKLTTYIASRCKWSLMRNLKNNKKMECSQEDANPDTFYLPVDQISDYIPEYNLTETELNILALKYKGYTFEEMSELLDENKATIHRKYKKLAIKLQDMNK